MSWSCDELWSTPDGDLHLEHDVAIGTRLVRGFRVEELQTLASADAGLELAVGWQLLAVALQQHVERVFLPLETEHDVLGLRFVDALDQRVLDQTEDRDLVIGRQPAIPAGAREIDAHAVLVDQRLDIPAKCRHKTEVVEDHRPQLEDEPPQLLQGLVHHLPQRRELATRLLGVHVEETLADLRLEDDVRHRLRRAVVDLAGDALAFFFLRVDDGLKETALVDQRRRIRRQLRRAVLGELTLRRCEDLRTTVDKLSLRLQRVELTFHGHAPRHRGRVLVGRAKDLLALEVAWVLSD